MEITVVRSSHNTCDLRGARVEEAFVTLEQYFDHDIKRAQEDFCTAWTRNWRIESGVRGWLSSSNYVILERLNADEIGDAFTVVDLK